MEAGLSLAGWLRDARLARGWTHRELARRAHISPSAIHRAETGERGPGMKTLQGIARAFEIAIQIDETGRLFIDGKEIKT